MQNKKICNECGIEKSLSAFNKDRRLPKGRKNRCRQCTRHKDRQRYKRNKGSILEDRRNRKEAVQIQVWEFLEQTRCTDCGEDNPIVLEFDHQRDKEYIISNMIRSGYSWESIKQEIDKCEVRCANCHRKRTARDQGWFTAVDVEGV